MPKKKTTPDLEVPKEPSLSASIDPITQDVELTVEESISLIPDDQLIFFDNTLIKPGVSVSTNRYLVKLNNDGSFDYDVRSIDSKYHRSSSILRSTLPRPQSIREPELAPIRSVYLGTMELQLRPGVTLIVGQSTKGKTTLLSELISVEELIIWNEPREEALYSTVEVAVMLGQMLPTYDVIGVDSISSILYEGPTKIEKGLSAESLSALARIDSFMRKMKKVLICTFAPMVMDDASLEAIATSVVNQKISQGIFLPEVGTMKVSDRGAGNRAWTTSRWTPTSSKGGASTPVENHEDMSTLGAGSFQAGVDYNLPNKRYQAFLNTMKTDNK